MSQDMDFNISRRVIIKAKFLKINCSMSKDMEITISRHYVESLLIGFGFES